MRASECPPRKFVLECAMRNWRPQRSTGVINLWAAITIRQQGKLVYLLALGVFLAGVDGSRRLDEKARGSAVSIIDPAHSTSDVDLLSPGSEEFVRRRASQGQTFIVVKRAAKPRSARPAE
jgi:hypothetical protein